MKKLMLRAAALSLAAMLLLVSCGLAETIKLRDRSDNVLALQTALAEMGYYDGDIDGYFGTGTLKAVKEFQATEGLKVDGLVGKATQAKITAITGIEFDEGDDEETSNPSSGSKTLFNGDYRTMQFGTAGARVRIMQRALLALGFNVKVDGDFGSTTHKAVKAFQNIVGLTVDGKAGKRTLQKLEKYFDEDGNCISGPIAGNEPAAPEVDPDAPIYGIPERTLRYGYTGLDVMYTMQRLYDLGYYDKTVDDKFGAGMLRAVKAFQKKNSLAVDGAVGPKTRAVLFSAGALDEDDAIPEKEQQTEVKLPLKKGDRGTAVKEVQARLEELGYELGLIDGIFGKGTQAAVKLFQARNGLTVDGKVGQRTLDKLFSGSAVPADGVASEGGEDTGSDVGSEGGADDDLNADG